MSVEIMQIKTFTILLLLVLHPMDSVAWSLFGPKNYEDCIFDKLEGVNSDRAAIAIKNACKKKFSGKKKKTKFGSTGYEDCILDKMPSVNSDRAATEIKRACRKRYPSEEQIIRSKSKPLDSATDWAMTFLPIHVPDYSLNSTDVDLILQVHNLSKEITITAVTIRVHFRNVTRDYKVAKIGSSYYSNPLFISPSGSQKVTISLSEDKKYGKVRRIEIVGAEGA